MEKSTKISDGANVCYITVNFNYPIHEETDMPISRVSNKRTNKNAVSTTKKQKNDEHYSETFSPDSTASPSFLGRSGMDQRFIFHQNNTDFFQMTKKTKGKVIIISNRFSGTKREREGTKIDEKSLKQTFTYLNGKNAEIYITPLFNLSAREIKEHLKLFADSDEIPSFYAIVIMSHGAGRKRNDGGLDDMIEGSDHTLVNVEDVIGIFNKENLKDVPILMFFQMCRGVRKGAARVKNVEAVDSFDHDKDNEDDDNVETDDHEDDDDVESAIEKSQRTLLRMVLPGARFIGSEDDDENDQTDAEGFLSSENDAGECSTSGNDEIDDSALIHVRGTNNMMISFSTTEDFVSLRHKEEGSWFIQAVCREIEKNAKNKDLVAIMNEVHHVVHDKRSENKKFMQCIIACDTAHTFHDKKLFFFPGLPK